MFIVAFFFFKQKTAYEMRISDWSSDVCSSDLTISDDRIAEAFEARKDQLSRPERRTVTQAVLPDEAAARALADRLAEGATFAAAAEENGRASCRERGCQYV